MFFHHINVVVFFIIYMYNTTIYLFSFYLGQAESFIYKGFVVFLNAKPEKLNAMVEKENAKTEKLSAKTEKLDAFLEFGIFLKLTFFWRNLTQFWSF